VFFRQIRDDSGRRETLQTLGNQGRVDVGGLVKTIVVNFESGVFKRWGANDRPAGGQRLKRLPPLVAVESE
jgi:hypothetical protein